MYLDWMFVFSFPSNIVYLDQKIWWQKRIYLLMYMYWVWKQVIFFFNRNFYLLSFSLIHIPGIN